MSEEIKAFVDRLVAPKMNEALRQHSWGRAAEAPGSDSAKGIHVLQSGKANGPTIYLEVRPYSDGHVSIEVYWFPSGTKTHLDDSAREHDKRKRRDIDRQEGMPISTDADEKNGAWVVKAITAAITARA